LRFDSRHAFGVYESVVYFDSVGRADVVFVEHAVAVALDKAFIRTRIGKLFGCFGVRKYLREHSALSFGFAQTHRFLAHSYDSGKTHVFKIMLAVLRVANNSFHKKPP